MSNPRQSIEDKEANLFAMYLLMPGEMVIGEILKMKRFDLLNDQHVKHLAKKFQVSVPVMAFRIGMLEREKEL